MDRCHYLLRKYKWMEIIYLGDRVIGARVTKTEDCHWHPKGAYPGLVYFWSYEEGDLCFVVAETR